MLRSPFHLAIDTSTARPLVALLREDELLAEWEGPAGTQHHESLLPGVSECLKRSGKSTNDLSFLSVGLGPGMFTGLRIGIATAQFLADAHGLQVAPVSSLLALSLSAKVAAQTAGAKRLWAVSDAKSRRVYAMCSEIPSLDPSLPPSAEEEVALFPEEFAEKIQKGDALAGEGAKLYGSSWPAGTTVLEPLLSALWIGRVGWSLAGSSGLRNPQEIQPRYLKTGQPHL